MALGTNLYMIGKSARFTPVFQYFFDDLSQANRAIDVSKHVQGMLPPSLQSVTGSVSSSSLVAIAKASFATRTKRYFRSIASADWGLTTTWEVSSDGATGWASVAAEDNGPQPWDEITIRDIQVDLDSGAPGTDSNGYKAIVSTTLEEAQFYTYRWYDAGQERQQSAWGTWTYGTTNLLDAKVMDDEIYIVEGKTRLLVPKFALTKSRSAKTSTSFQGLQERCTWTTSTWSIQV